MQRVEIKEASLAQFKAAQAAGGTHLSQDGETVYMQRLGQWYAAYWDGREFGSWFLIAALPAEAVAL